MNQNITKLAKDSKSSFEAFVKVGFENWNKAIERFKSQEKTDMHRHACYALSAAKHGTNVLTALSQSKDSKNCSI